MPDYAVYVTREVSTKYLVDADSIEEAVKTFRDGEVQWSNIDEVDISDDSIVEVYVEAQDEEGLEADFDREAYFARLNTPSI